MNIFIAAPIGEIVAPTVMDQVLVLCDQVEAAGHNPLCEHRLIAAKLPRGDARAVVQRSLFYLDSCQAAIFYLPGEEGKPPRSDGLFVELGYALGQNKHCLLLAENCADKMTAVVQGLAGDGQLQLENHMKNTLTAWISHVEETVV